MAVPDLVRAALRARPVHALFRVAIGASVTALVLVALEVEGAVDRAYEATDRACHGADFRATFQARSYSGAREAIRGIPGLANASFRMQLFGDVEGPLARVPLAIQLLPDPDPEVQAPLLVAGALPFEPGEVALESGLADALGVRPGQTVRIGLHGVSREARVSGLVLDFGKAPYPNWTYGAAYVPYDLAARTFAISGEEPVVNTVDVAIEAGASVDAVRSALARTLDLDRRDILSRRFFRQITEAALDPLVLMLRVFAVVAALTGSAFLIEDLSARIARDRRRIGLLAMLGAPWSTIALSYAGEILLPVLAGAAAGIPLGRLLASYPVDRMAAGLGLIRPEGLAISACLASIGVSLGAGAVSAALPVLFLARGDPSAVVRGDRPPAGNALVRLLRGGGATPAGIGFRLALGHPLRGAVTVLGIGSMLAAIYFILAMRGFVRDFENPAVHGFRYDLIVAADDLPGALAALDRNPKVAEADSQRRTWARFGEDGLGAIVYGYDPSERLHRPRRMLEGRWLAGPGEAVLGRALANRLGAKVGHCIPLGPGASPVVVGIAQSFFNGGYIVFTDDDSFRRAFPSVGAVIMVRLVDGATPRDIESPGVAANRVSSFHCSFGGTYLGTAAYVLTFISIVLGAAATIGLFTSVGAIVRQRQRTFAILRALGASPSQVLGVVAGVTALLAGLSAILGVAVAHEVYVPMIGAVLLRDYGPVDIPLAPVPLAVYVAVVAAVAGAAALAAGVQALHLVPSTTLRGE